MMYIVVVEKPVGLNHEEFKRAIDAADKSGKLLIPFQSKFCHADPMYLQRSTPGYGR